MRARAVLSLCAAVGAVPASAAGAQQPPAAYAAPRASGPLADSLRAFAIDMAALLRARDVDAVVGLYGDTTHFVHVEEGTVIPWSQLSRTMRTYFATATTNPVTVVGEPGVTLVDRNTAVVYVTHRSDASAGRPAHDGVWTGVLRRGSGGWKIVHSHSSDRPPAGPPRSR
jgi:ketosteroid isomerase-like protein